MNLISKSLLPISLFSPILSIAEEKMNVLFIMLDDLQSTAVNYNGNSQVVSPNIDNIYSNGVSFTNTYTNGAIGGALSMPSRAMVMTGRGIFEVKRDGEYIPDEHITLPQLLRNNGYNTFATGKWHNCKNSFHRSFENGGYVFFGGMHQYHQNGHVTPYLRNFDPTGKYEGQPFIGDKFSSEMFADKAVDFLKAQKKSKEPFFAYVAFTSPHDPRDQHPDYGHKYDPKEIDLPINFANRHPFNTGDMYVRDEVLLPHYREEEAVKEDIANYYQMVSEVDVQIGRIVDALKESGEYDNTIIILASDNGLAVGQHGLLGKQNLYEHSISVPLVVSLPGGAKGVESKAYNYLSDIYPTLCDVLGIEAPETVTGKSFAPAIENQSQRNRTQLFLAYSNVQRGLVRDGWKYIIYNVDGCETEQLFNLNDDPWEMVNLAEHQAYQTIKRAYKNELKKEMKKGNDFCDLDKPMWGYGPHMVKWVEAIKLYD